MQYGKYKRYIFFKFCNRQKVFSQNLYISTMIDRNGLTPGLNLNLDKSQCTGAIDSANNAVLSADFKNVIFKMIHWA